MDTSASDKNDHLATLRPEYRRLIDKKLRSGLTDAEEAELADIRDRINAADRMSPVWDQYQRSAEIIEQKLADLRREIESY